MVGDPLAALFVICACDSGGLRMRFSRVGSRRGLIRLMDFGDPPAAADRSSACAAPQALPAAAAGN